MTWSPAARPPAWVSAACAATAERPRAASRVSGTPAGSATTSTVGTATVVAMLPSTPERIPADVPNQTGVPSASRPTPCTPGTYGVLGGPK
ncbi:hypothetical protein PSN01_05674 [Micromonospora saelicesensis]|nr:hypothetical protein PSN01_05674 [Micromonospora saelicesensis]